MMPSHPAADLFPLMSEAELIELGSDIEKNGQCDPIVLLNGAILDGRNRQRACDLLGIKAITTEWCGTGSPEAYVISKNLHRRHLNDNQRALVASKIATKKPSDSLIPAAYQKSKSLDMGNPITRDPVSSQGITQKQAAHMLNVSYNAVLDARKVLTEAEPEEIILIEQGSIGLGALAKQIKTGLTAADRAATRAGIAPKAKPSKSRTNPKDPHADRKQTQQQNAKIWSALRKALEAINGLPSAPEVARSKTIQQYSRHFDVIKQTERAMLWLQQFSQAWETKNECDHE